jgi:hypothetical protein
LLAPLALICSPPRNNRHRLSSFPQCRLSWSLVCIDKRRSAAFFSALLRRCIPDSPFLLSLLELISLRIPWVKTAQERLEAAQESLKLDFERQEKRIVYFER